MPVIYLKLVLTAFFWGGTFIAGRILSQDLDPFTAAFLRFVFATSFLLFILLRTERRLPPMDLKKGGFLFLLGMTGVFSYNVFFFLGLQTVTAGRAALIIALNPVLITFSSALLLRERIRPAQGLGIVFCLVGASVVIARGNPLDLLQGTAGWGELFLLLCVVSWVSYSLLGKKVMGYYSPVASVTYSCIFGTAALLVPALLHDLTSSLASISMLGWGCLLYLGIFGTGLGFSWYYQGIQKIGPTRAGVFINLVPVSAILLSALILDEPLTGALLAGGGLVLAGLSLTNLPGIRLLGRRHAHTEC
ncbi:MAG: DMT family transporter [Desulfovibrionales bacterium]